MSFIREIIWRKPAILYLENAIDYIRKDSVKNADTVANAILAAVEKAARFPEHFPLDKYKLNNTGSFRAFEMYSFRISFYCNEEIIRIVRTRHTKQKPLHY
jgi:plasmid stabilization system protein ParE